MHKISKIILADFSRKQELTELWVEAFGDGEEFISSFLDAYMIPEYNVPVVLEENGKIASMFYLIEFDLYSNRKNLGKCAYLFAAATKKEYRNKGCMSELIKYAVELYKNRGFKAIFLFPQNQNQKLFDYYAKFGFENIFSAKKIIVGHDDPGVPRKKNAFTDIHGASGMPRPTCNLRLEDKDITDVDIFDGLYDSYIEFTARQILSPIKDRLFYFKCAKSYLDNSENPEITPHFAVFENNVEKFCYVFYKKYKNTYYIDDIIFTGYDNISNIIETLSGYILNFGDNVNIEINIPPVSQSDSQNVPLAMLLPLSGDIKNITGNIKVPVYLNMFMNL